MNILILGGTRSLGKEIIKVFLKSDNTITILNRGTKENPFQGQINTVLADRNDEDSIKQLKGKHYDLVVDSSAFCGLNVKYILDNIETDRYILISTIGCVGFNPSNTNPLNLGTDFENYGMWGNKYVLGKKEAEWVLKQNSNISSAIIRPGDIVNNNEFNLNDKFLCRWYQYVEHIYNGKPMWITNPNYIIQSGLAMDIAEFVKFLSVNKNHNLEYTFRSLLATKLTMRDLIHHIENKLNKKAIFSIEKSDFMPMNVFNGTGFCDITLLKKTGYMPLELVDWFIPYLDSLIEKTKN
ncbi:MAG: hypothetical protein LBM93_16040 [Oscillospiraceae bacterium]|nr:hypothetical protein [Oscillospiraceae bacterium]